MNDGDDDEASNAGQFRSKLSAWPFCTPLSERFFAPSADRETRCCVISTLVEIGILRVDKAEVSKRRAKLVFAVFRFFRSTSSSSSSNLDLLRGGRPLPSLGPSCPSCRLGQDESSCCFPLGRSSLRRVVFRTRGNFFERAKAKERRRSWTLPLSPLSER